MPISPEDLTSTPANYVTPAQIEQTREYAKYLLQGNGQQSVNHWTQGVSNMTSALLGNLKNRQAEQQQVENTFGAGQEAAAVRPPGAPPLGSSGPQASAAPGSGPASVRNNNPGGQWPGEVASQYGATGSQTIGGGNKIATFPDPVSGAAAQFALLDKRYTGIPLGAAIGKWSGGNSASAYAQHIAQRTGLTPDTVITPQLLRSPQGIALGKAMADWEAGGKSPLSDQQWTQAHQKAFGPAGGGQTADLSGHIGGNSSPNPGSPQAMSGALAGGGAPPTAMAASGGSVPGGPPLSSVGSTTLGPEYANQRAHVGQGQMGRILGNQWIKPEIQDSIYGQYMQQYQPTELKTTGGRIVFPHQGPGVEIPDLQKGELDAGGVKAPYMGTITTGPGGKPQYQGLGGVPGVEGTPPAASPDLHGLPGMTGKPEAAPQPGGDPSFGGLPDMHGTGPRSSLEQAPTAAGQASPMGQMAEAGAAPSQAEGTPGAKTALAVPGNIQSDAPPIGGMLGSPPPQAQAAPSPPPGPQVAQASGGLPSLGQLRDFKLDMDKRGELNKEDAKKFTENSNALLQAGTQAQQGLPMLKLAQQAVKDPKYYSGIGAGAVLNWKQLKAAVGDDPNAAAAMEVFEKSMAGDVLSQLRSKLQGLGQVRLAEIDLLTRSTANKFNTPKANEAVLNIIERGYNQMGAISRITDAYSRGVRLDEKGNWIKKDDLPTNGGLTEIVQKYLSLHPTFNQQEIKDFNKTLDLDDKKPEPEPTTYTNSKAGQPPEAKPAQPNNLQLLLEERARRQGK